MFFIVVCFFILKNMQYKICRSSHWQTALSLFFSVYHSVLADKLVEKSDIDRTHVVIVLY